MVSVHFNLEPERIIDIQIPLNTLRAETNKHFKVPTALYVYADLEQVFVDLEDLLGGNTTEDSMFFAEMVFSILNDISEESSYVDISSLVVEFADEILDNNNLEITKIEISISENHKLKIIPYTSLGEKTEFIKNEAKRYYDDNMMFPSRKQVLSALKQNKKIISIEFNKNNDFVNYIDVRNGLEKILSKYNMDILNIYRLHFDNIAQNVNASFDLDTFVNTIKFLTEDCWCAFSNKSKNITIYLELNKILKDKGSLIRRFTVNCNTGIIKSYKEII